MTASRTDSLVGTPLCDEALDELLAYCAPRNSIALRHVPGIIEELRATRTALTASLAAQETMRRLVEVAKCPNGGCNGKGFKVVPDPYGGFMKEQCQWCDERSKLCPAAIEGSKHD